MNGSRCEIPALASNHDVTFPLMSVTKVPFPPVEPDSGQYRIDAGLATHSMGQIETRQPTGAKQANYVPTRQRAIDASASWTEDLFSCLLRAAFPLCSLVTHDFVGGGGRGSESDWGTRTLGPRLSSMVMMEHHSHDVSHGQVPAHFPPRHQWPRAAPRRLDAAARPPISRDT